MRLILIILTCFISTICFCQACTISGLVLDLTTKQPLKGAKIQLLSIVTNEDTIAVHYYWDSTYKIVAETFSDTTGNFVLLNIRAQKYSLACFYKMNGERMFLKSIMSEDLGRTEIDSNIVIKAGETYYRLFYLMITCPYNKTKDQSFCPNCMKSDMVKPILYGSPLYDKDGNSVIKDLDKYYLGGCEPDIWCNPTKHCNRCNLDF